MATQRAAGIQPGRQTPASTARYGVVIARNVMVPMRDGVRLATDLYRPATDGEFVVGPWPTILLRTPYDKTRPQMTGHGEYFCGRGYVVAVQDCRGRFSSEGEYYHIANNEARDGYDTVEWIAAQPWSNGKVGTMGTSYGSIVQHALATQNPPHLAAMIPMEGGHNLYEYGWRQDGAANLKMITVGFWMAASSQEARANPAIKKALEGASIRDWLRQLPLKPGSSPDASLIRSLPQ